MKETRLPRGFGLLRDPLLLAPRMRDIYTNFKNHTFLKKTCFVAKKQNTTTSWAPASQGPTFAGTNYAGYY